MEIYDSVKINPGKFGYGIPDDLRSNIDGRWIPIGNVKNGQGFPRSYREKLRFPTRHKYQTCPECGARKKNIRRHYKLYHPEWYKKTFIDPFKKGIVGELYAVRFIETKVTNSFVVSEDKIASR